ncbi:hypothetical protein CYY_007580 [Polysphondylium violaceum]|uniref:VPS9 domain-containing protein n=1 Tax=Polysphondylium violaceum TaxID=133409 RepID=A0A8J4PPF6_9MYCE|nr:hypothetical protein CYY_007580 [Polysphondylium violaceum]
MSATTNTTPALSDKVAEEKDITNHQQQQQEKEEEGRENVIISSTTPPLNSNNNNNNNKNNSSSTSSSNSSTSSPLVQNINNTPNIINSTTISSDSNNINNNNSQQSPLTKSSSNNNFRSSLSSFLTNYTLKSNPTTDGGEGSSSSTWLLGHFKSSISLITNNIPIPSSLPYPSIPTIGSISSFTNNIPVLSYLSNSIPFPINYSKNNTKDNVNNNSNNSSNTQPSPQLKKQLSNNNLTATTSATTTNANKMTFNSIDNKQINYYNLGNEDQFEDIINRLENTSNHRHILSTIETFIDSITSDSSLSVEDISSSVKAFISTTLPMLLNACAGVPFYPNSESVIESKSPCIPSLIGKNAQEVEIIVYEFLEQFITSRLYRRIFSSPDGIQKDTKLCEHISNFQHITPSNLDINDHLISNQFLEQIQEELLHMTAYKSPREKLNCIMKSFKTLFQLLSKSSVSTNSIGADLLLPIVIYCLIKSNLPFLYSNLQYISLFRDPSLIEAETNYYLITLITATSFIEDMTFDSLTNAVDPSKEQSLDTASSLSNSNSSLNQQQSHQHDDTSSVNSAISSSSDQVVGVVNEKEQQQKQQHETLKQATVKSDSIVKNVNSNNSNNRDLFQEKKKNWKYYHSKPEDLSIKDVKQLLLDYNRLVDSFYQNKN